MNNSSPIIFIYLLVFMPFKSFSQNYWAKENFRKGEIELQLGNFKSAIQFYNKSIGTYKDYTAAYFSRGKAYLELENIDKALEDFYKTIQLDNSHPDPYFYLGAIHYKEGKYNDAIIDFDKATEADSTFAIAYNYKAEAYRELGLNSQAINNYSKAITYQSQEPILYFGRSKCYLEIEQYIKAIQDLNIAIALDPPNFTYYQHRAEASFLAGDYKGASQDIKTLVKIDSSAVELYYYGLNAVCLAETKNYKEAIEALNQVIKYENEQADLYAERADYWLGANNTSNAIRDYKKAIAIQPKNTIFYLKCGELYYNQGDNLQAIHYFSEYLKHHEEVAEIWYKRGLAQLNLGRKKDAKADFIKAAKLDFPKKQMSIKASKYTKKVYKELEQSKKH